MCINKGFIGIKFRSAKPLRPSSNLGGASTMPTFNGTGTKNP